MNFDMPNKFPFHQSGLYFESSMQAHRREREGIRNEEGSLSTFSSIEKEINEGLYSVAGIEYPYEKMLSALTGKRKNQKTTKDIAVKFPQKVSNKIKNSYSCLLIGPACWFCHYARSFSKHSTLYVC